MFLRNNNPAFTSDGETRKINGVKVLKSGIIEIASIMTEVVLLRWTGRRRF